MKCLTIEEANQYLNRIGAAIGNWNEVKLLDVEKKRVTNWTNYQAPKEALKLYTFSLHVAGWLPKGDWKLFQIDNSNNLEADEAFLLNRLLFGPDKCVDFLTSRSFLFEYGANAQSDYHNDLTIASLIYLFLLFECHGYLVSSGGGAAEIIGVQDGFVYFISKNADLSRAVALVSRFEKDPLSLPQWILDFDSAAAKTH